MSNLITQLNALSLPPALVQELFKTVSERLKRDAPEQVWQYVIKEILTQKKYKTLPFEVHKALYELVYPNWARVPGIASTPTEETIKSANVTNFMQALGFHDYQKLHDWSVKNYPMFWHNIIQNLNIIFSRDYDYIVDLSAGIENPKWLQGAKLNIANSCFKANPNRIAIINQTEEGYLTRLTYGELDKLSNQVARSLQQYCEMGDRIAIIMPMTPEAVAIYLGIIKAGCCVVSIADSVAAMEITTRLKIAHVKAIFTQDYILRDEKILPLYAKVKEVSALFTIVLPVNQVISQVEIKMGDMHWKDFLLTKEINQVIICQPHAYTNILFSSGTTDVPKAIPWDHVTPIKCGSDAYLYQNIQPNDILCWPTNLGWMMGPWLIYAGLLNNATIALYAGVPNGKTFGKFIQDVKVTVLGLVPSHVRNWRVSGCMEEFDWHNIKLFSSSGECSNVEDMLYLMSLANYCPIIEYCGGTEIGGAYLSSTVIHPSAPSTFVGPTLGLDFLILDAEGKPTQNGEIMLIPPSIGFSNELLNKDHHKIYYEDTLHCLNKPLRRHGDQVEHLVNGLYRMHGRVDDTMNLSGIKVSSVEIESVLNQLPYVNEAVAIPVNPTGDGPSFLVIYVILKDKEAKLKDQLKIMMQKVIKKNLNPLFKIYDVMVVATLPRTASNKLIRRKLRDHYHRILKERENKD